MTQQFPFNDWSIAEIDKLKQLSAEKFSPEMIATVLDRSPSEILSKERDLQQQAKWRAETAERLGRYIPRVAL